MPAPFGTAMAYYKAAFRGPIKARHPQWTRQEVESTLSWLWQNINNAARNDCDQRVINHDIALPNVDQNLISATPKRKDDPYILIQVEGHRLNTSDFYYWPDENADDLQQWIDWNPAYPDWIDRGAFYPGNTRVEDRSWRGIYILANRGPNNSKVGVWTLDDLNGNVTDRVAIKDVQADRKTWRDPISWRDHLPREVAMHERIEQALGLPLHDDGNHRHIVFLRGCRLRIKQRRYRLYMDFCWKRDLDRACLLPRQQNHFQLPETYLWYLLRALARACVLLRDGGEQEQPWKQIVHCDLQPSNIFLMDRYESRERPPGAAGKVRARDNDPMVDEGVSEDLLSNWLVPVIGDFGDAMFNLQDADDENEDNPMDYIISNDDYCLAPHQEQFTAYHENHVQGITQPGHEDVNGNLVDPPPRLQDLTNVWGIGMIMWNLLTNFAENTRGPKFDPGGPIIPGTNNVRWLSDQRIYTVDEVEEHVLEDDQAWPSLQAYSRKIKDLVKRCLHYEQTDRIPLDDLLQETQDAMNNPPDDMDPDTRIDYWDSAKVDNDFRSKNAPSRHGSGRDDGDIGATNRNRSNEEISGAMNRNGSEEDDER